MFEIGDKVASHILRGTVPYDVVGKVTATLGDKWVVIDNDYVVYAITTSKVED